MEIFFIMLGIIILWLGVIMAIAADDSKCLVKGVLAAIAGALIVGLFLTRLINTTEEETTIKCLQENNLYKMEIQYELRDSVYIPVDTIYVKIE